MHVHTHVHTLIHMHTYVRMCVVVFELSLNRKACIPHQLNAFSGREATQADVHNLVKQLNIQFDNLCQV